MHTSVEYAVPASVASDYLADPRHRPEWQSSLRRVTLLDDGGVRVGQRWRDHTAVGMTPLMETTELQPGAVWSETGRWRGVQADLTLRFQDLPSGTGSRVDAELEIRGTGPWRPVAWAATRAGLPAVRADLKRAGRILAGRVAG